MGFVDRLRPLSPNEKSFAPIATTGGVAIFQSDGGEWPQVCHLYPSQNETESGCLPKIRIVAACGASTLPAWPWHSQIQAQPQAQSPMRNRLPPRFEIPVSY